VNKRAVDTKLEGLLNILSKKEIRRVIRGKDSEYIVFYISYTKELPILTDPRINDLFIKYADIFLEELPKELPPK
jgi:hypothetical protein